MNARSAGRGATSSHAPASPTDVVFAVMPFADIRRPVLGVSLLQAAAKAHGYTSRIEYCSIEFADLVGRDIYCAISQGMRAQYLVGEWVFAEAAFGASIPPAEEYVRRVLGPKFPAAVIEQIVGVRSQCDDYLDACAERIMGHRPRVVGFTTTFHQTCASLAVAKRLKERPDAPAIAFGGANCEGEMGVQLLRSFPWIDAVSTGEADATFPRLLPALIEGRTERIGGVLFRGQELADHALRPVPVQDLDALPIPDFDDYFHQLDASAGGRDPGAHLVVETSRGCWWGAKHHCTFCGLNGNTLAFRSKTPQRAYDEITTLAGRHDTLAVESVDNILDMRYVDTLLPMLAEDPLELEFFYEVKANLRYEQLRKLRAAGIRHIQPGVESFSNQVLKLMDKGVTGLQNIQLLRWCEELDIQATWNIIGGFPGEDPDEYRRTNELIPQLLHLRPPMSMAQLRLDRFSPNFNNRDELGFANVRPSLAYSLVFPLGREELEQLAYFFDYDYEDGRVPRTYLAPLQEALDAWWAQRPGDPERARLDADVVGDAVVITDTRPIACAGRYEIDGLTAQVYLACDSASSLATLLRRPELAGREVEVRAALEWLADERLLVSDDGRHLSLAVFRSRPPADGSASKQAESGASGRPARGESAASGAAARSLSLTEG